MTDTRKENRNLWDEWSEDFQALWNANTAEGEAPPAPCPFTDDPPGGPQPALLTSVEGIDFVELGCGGGREASARRWRAPTPSSAWTSPPSSSNTRDICGTTTASTRSSSAVT